MTPEAFTELLRRHTPLIRRIAFAWCKDPGEREDVAQEIACQLWRSKDRLDPDRRESTWVWRVALNVAISSHRRQARHDRRRDDRDPALFALAPVDGPDEDSERLHAAIGELPPLDRALVLSWLEGNDHRTTAEALGISESNVGTRLQRLKARLRALLQPTPHPPERG
ncbi:MAG: sigma-70 family RNA polymerase sigma factor [Planctomycetes bacterium]|nr:sigma-70 family RNA polymerase sigma factor [Planctomycetota bacterium]